MEKTFLQKYADNHKLRAIVNIVPHIGGALDVLLSEKGNKWREDRLNKLLIDLDNRLSKAENQKAIFERFETEEFYDLILQALNSAMKTRHMEKINLYSNILFNHLNQKDSNELSSELFLSVLDNLTLNEINYLGFLNSYNRNIELHEVFGCMIHWDKYQEKLIINGNKANSRAELPTDCIFGSNKTIIWKLLIDKNLVVLEEINTPGHLQFNYQTSNQQLADYIEYTLKKVYMTTDFGNEFIDWIMVN